MHYITTAIIDSPKGVTIRKLKSDFTSDQFDANYLPTESLPYYKLINKWNDLASLMTQCCIKICYIYSIPKQ